jgi:putative membrane protein
MLLYLKALHIVFVVTWFSGMFYIVRLFIYNAETLDKPAVEREVLQRQYTIMIKRLWFGITWPSAILTLILGTSVLFSFGYNRAMPQWLWIKIGFVFGLYLYHFTLHAIYKQQMNHIFKYTSQQLRIWNEMATIFLIAIVMLVVVRQNMSWVWGLLGLLGFVIILMSAIKIYKVIRSRS